MVKMGPTWFVLEVRRWEVTIHCLCGKYALFNRSFISWNSYIWTTHKLQECCWHAVLLANALVSSSLDYCNSLEVGVTKVNFSELQRVQNSLARANTITSKYDCIIPVFNLLHWLPVQQRTNFKIDVIACGQPQYLHHILIPLPYHHSTRFSDFLSCTIPQANTALSCRASSELGHRL